ncbi:uncharacterized protein TNIN_158161 [Trichonephila inaurata madagascariensis]|uniref:Gustatory receptor n=1 Tax=Trichonephila inaurata madagascariensis TaxID=2747483 RepID=A0A8X6KHI0_9ARAC|nr:uncharacterized protein TNIN_158161 [Trichonephila inaurata madagascariensis]
MFTVLGQALGISGLSLEFQIGESLLTGFYCSLLIIYLISSLSNIPETLEEISTILQNVYRKELLKCNETNHLDTLRLMMLKTLSEIKPISITVWDMFRVNRSLLLSSFGCLLTFGILITQLQRNDI